MIALLRIPVSNEQVAIFQTISVNVFVPGKDQGQEGKGAKKASFG